jgi:hypothetical protein
MPSPTPCSAAPKFTPVTARFRQSKRIGKVPVQEGNIYGESRHPVKQFQDIQQESTWEGIIKSPNRFQSLEDSKEIPGPSSTIPVPPEPDTSFRKSQAPSETQLRGFTSLDDNTELATQA